MEITDKIRQLVDSGNDEMMVLGILLVINQIKTLDHLYIAKQYLYDNKHRIKRSKYKMLRVRIQERHLENIEKYVNKRGEWKT